MTRQASLYLVPDFPNYMLAIGFILAAMVSAAGNYVLLVGILPVGAMAGFISQLQFVILGGILHVVGTDEVSDHHSSALPACWRTLLRSAVLLR